MNSPIVEMMDDENAMSRESSNNSQGSKAASLAENNEYNNECQHIYGFKVSTGRVRLLRVYKSFLVVYGVESEAKRTVLDFEFLEDADITELKAYCEAGRFAEFINVGSSFILSRSFYHSSARQQSALNCQLGEPRVSAPSQRHNISM